MSKFNKQPVTSKFNTPRSNNNRPTLNKPIIQQSIMPETKKHLKDTVRQIIEQIKEQKQLEKANTKTFKQVVDIMMKNKSRVKNENVLKLANSIILSQQPKQKISNDQIQNIPDETNIQPQPISNNHGTPLSEHQVIDSIIYPALDTFSQTNPMSLKFQSDVNVSKLRFGSALNKTPKSI